MFSYIYQLARDFETEHGERPNLLYLNPAHYDQMKNEFPDPEVLAGLLARLDMEIFMDKEIMHPHVARMPMVVSGTG